jgi:hypothetical protein
MTGYDARPFRTPFTRPPGRPPVPMRRAKLPPDGVPAAPAIIARRRRRMAMGPKTYTTYLVDRSGRLSTPRAISAHSDAEALDKAELLLSADEDGEVWRDGECVGRVHGFEQVLPL